MNRGMGKRLHTCNRDLAICKENETMTFAGKCIEPESIMLNEISHTHRHCSFPLLCKIFLKLYTDVCAYGVCVLVGCVCACMCLCRSWLERDHEKRGNNHKWRQEEVILHVLKTESQDYLGNQPEVGYRAQGKVTVVERDEFEWTDTHTWKCHSEAHYSVC